VIKEAVLFLVFWSSFKGIFLYDIHKTFGIIIFSFPLL
jgi:hypothetical protein